MRDWWDYFTTGHIAISANGWTINELCLKQLKKCFDPESRKYQKGEYRMLIFDGHTSHINSEAIRFYMEQKIILFCEAPYTSHLCQPCDCGVFLPLVTQIKLGIQFRCRFNLYYAIDKCDFLEILEEARTKAFTVENIKSAWANTGLYLFDPDVILSQLLKVSSTDRLTTPPESTQ